MEAPTSDQETRSDSNQTLAEFFYYFSSETLRRELEKYRLEYEKDHGPTDLTRRYTSTWPQDQQLWLIRNHPKEYWDGLPEFVQAYLIKKTRLAARSGRLDEFGDAHIRMYLQGELTVNGRPWNG